MPKQPKARNEIGRKPDSDPNHSTSTFLLAELRRAQEETMGFSAIGGAAAAVLSSHEDESQFPDELELQDDTGKEPDEAADEQLNLGQKFMRFFSRKIDFTINNSRITGKNGYQVRGGSVKLMPGAVMDLSTAPLTGFRNGQEQSATGMNAQLYLSPVDSQIVTRQELRSVYIRSDQKILANSLVPIRLTLAEHQLTLGTVEISQAPGAQTASISFQNAQLESNSEGGAAGQSQGKVTMKDGVVSIQKLSLDNPEQPITLMDLTLSGNQLRFGSSKAKQVTTSGGLLRQDTVPSLLEEAERVILSRMEPKTLTELLSKIQSTVQPQEESPQVPEPENFPLCGTTHNNLLIYSMEKENDTQGLFLMKTSLNAKGQYGVTLKDLTSEAKKVAFTHNDQNQISANLGKMKLKASDEQSQYSVEIEGAKLTDGVFSANKVYITKNTEEKWLESSSDKETGLGALLNFSIPKMPQEAAYRLGASSGDHTLDADFDEVVRGKFSIEELAGIFSVSIDLKEKSFSLAVTKDADVEEDGFFKEDRPLIPPIPIIPPLFFTLSIQPSAKINGSFSLSGQLPDEGETTPFGAEAKLGLDAGIQLNADLELGVGSVASLYLGLFGTAKANAGITASVGLDMLKKDGHLKAQQLNLGGAFDAGFTGSIGAHGGGRVLFWKAELFSYTFAKWELAKLAMAANFSKDMNQPFTKGWERGQSDFTAEVFGKKLNKDSLNIQTVEGNKLAAIQFEGDYQKLRGNLAAAVSAFQAIKAAMQGGKDDGSLVLIDTAELNKQAEQLIQLQNQLETMVATSSIQEDHLTALLAQLQAEIQQKQSKHGAAIAKHRDRYTYLSVAKRLHHDNAALPYDKVLEEAAAITKEKAEGQELAKLRVYDTLFAHETEREQKAISPEKHTARLKELKKWKQSLEEEQNAPQIADKKDDSKKIAMRNAIEHRKILELLQPHKTGEPEKLGDSAEARDLLKAFHQAVSSRVTGFTGTAGFERSDLYSSKKFEEMSTKEKLLTREKYEEGRYDFYSIDALADQTNQIIERLRKLKEIQRESAEIREILTPAKEAQAARLLDSGADAMFSKLMLVLERGTKLQETADKFNYLDQAATCRAQQQVYIREALAQVRQLD